MGTSSATVVYDEFTFTPVIRLFRQYDGYVRGGHGEELLDLLKTVKIVNGFSLEHEKEHSQGISHIANGMCDFAAQLVVAFKGYQVGGIYLHPHDMDDGADYTYHIRRNNDTFDIKVEHVLRGTIFNGPLEAYRVFVNNTNS